MSKKQLSNSGLALVSSQLGTVIESGVSITDGMLILSQDEENDSYRRLLLELLQYMDKGSSFTDAIIKSEKFPPYFVEMVKVGEKTGRLDTVLLSLSEYYSRMDEFSGTVKSGVTYAGILTLTVFAVTFVLATYVLPIFADVFSQLGLTLSDSALWIMTAGTATSKIVIWAVGILAGIIVLGVILYNLVPPVKRLMLNIASHTKTAKAMYTARFANAFSMALSSGLDIDQSIELCEKLLIGPKMRQQMEKCRNSMKEGKSFTEALEETKIFPSLYIRMITLGFSTGRLDLVMKDIAKKTGDKVNDMINVLVSRFEPAMVIIMAIAVGFILISVMLPLLGIMTVVG